MENLIEYTPLLLRGAVTTVLLALASLVMATLLGGLGAMGKISGGPITRAIVFAYTTLVRGVPDLVLILLIYFGGQRLINIAGKAVGVDYVELSKFWAGVAAIGFIYGAYLTETFRGAYMTVPAGQREAAMSMGMRPFQVLRAVTLPQLIRFALPGYANVWQVLIKSTAVVSVIGLEDLVGLANDAGKSVREPFLFFTAVFFAYLFFTWVSQSIFNYAERRYALKEHGDAV
ncbi:MAG TPA: ABC transporter permease subunit [Rhodobacteraceae bacterium]|nr:ABC transporter permease subunit [Paracoccaceae bacterium]